MKNNSFIDIRDRIKYLRKEILNIKQNEMSLKLGLKQGSLSDIERKKTKIVTDRVINDICREFNINENWLRYGKGEIFVENDSSIMSALSNKYNLDDLDRKIVEGYLNLEPHQRKAIKDYVYSIAGINTEEAATKELPPKEANSDLDIEKEVESYRLELEAEKKIRTSSASEDTKRTKTS